MDLAIPRQRLRSTKQRTSNADVWAGPVLSEVEGRPHPPSDAGAPKPHPHLWFPNDCSIIRASKQRLQIAPAARAASLLRSKPTRVSAASYACSWAIPPSSLAAPNWRKKSGLRAPKSGDWCSNSERWVWRSPDIPQADINSLLSPTCCFQK